MGPNKLADSLGISIEEAEDLLNKYDKTFPSLMNWLKESGNKAKKDMKAVTEDPCKRIRWFPNLKESAKLRKEDSKDWKTILTIEGEAERQGKNHLIQGSGANITKEALIGVRNLINHYNLMYKEEVAFLTGQVHDEINVEAREDIANMFSLDMEKTMIECGNKYVTKVKMKVDTTVTLCWTK